MAAKSRSAKFYQENPTARKKKDAYNTEFNKKPSQRKKRSELVSERRKRGVYGKGGDDLAHTSNGLRFKNPSKNRGSTKDMPGDRRARGKKKK